MVGINVVLVVEAFLDLVVVLVVETVLLLLLVDVRSM